MTHFSQLDLLRDNMSKPVSFNVTWTGEPTGQPGVTALILRQPREQGPSWCLLADHPQNPGVSVTNGVIEYAIAVCQTLECTLAELTWLELDSRGSFSMIRMLRNSVAFTPLVEIGARPCSLAALMRRARREFRHLPIEFGDAASVALQRFTSGEKENP